MDRILLLILFVSVFIIAPAAFMDIYGNAESTVRDDSDELSWMNATLSEKYIAQSSGLFGSTSSVYYMEFNVGNSVMVYDAISVDEYAQYDIGETVSIGYDPKYGTIDRIRKAV